MNTRIISAIAFKVFGIYVIVSAILALPSIYGTFMFLRNDDSGFSSSVFMAISISAITLVAALIGYKILWNLGNSVLKNVSDLNITEVAFDHDSFEKTLLRFLGIFFIITALVDIPGIATTIWAKSHIPDGVGLAEHSSIIRVVLQLGLGMSLVTKINNWLSFIRSLGIK